METPTAPETPAAPEHYIVEVDPRPALYQALSVLEDSLIDRYRGHRPVPEFATPVEDDTTGTTGTTGTIDADDADDPSRDLAGNRRSGSFGQVRAETRIPDNDSLETIAAEVARCRACRLSAGRTKVVPGVGAARPLVMVIGEGPGAEEDRSGVAFVGPAGQLLDKMLGAIGLSRQANCFIGNIVKCRPPMNRDPAPDEQSACMPYLDRQIALLRPRTILAVGRIPAQALLGVRDGIGKLRGHQYLFRGIPLVATYHPSALLRDETLKRPAWEDMKLLKAILDGMEGA